MSRQEKTRESILSGESDANVDFDDLCQFLTRLGFARRTKGSHQIFTKAGVRHRINLQRAGRQAKPYQVRQIREILAEYPQL